MSNNREVIVAFEHRHTGRQRKRVVNQLLRNRDTVGNACMYVEHTELHNCIRDRASVVLLS
jgi:hypothetical protein